MESEKLIADLIRDEGLRRAPYDDATGRPFLVGDTLKGRLTIGVGRNLSNNGIRESEARLLLANDVADVVAELDARLPWWKGLSEPQRRGLANMAFNMGVPRLLGFRNMLLALQAGLAEGAAAEALDSQWARQVGDRALRIATLFRTG